MPLPPIKCSPVLPDGSAQTVFSKLRCNQCCQPAECDCPPSSRCVASAMFQQGVLPFAFNWCCLPLPLIFLLDPDCAEDSQMADMEEDDDDAEAAADSGSSLQAELRSAPRAASFASTLR